MSVNDVDSLYKKVKDNNLKIFLDLETHEYEVNGEIYYDKEFLIQDLDGYLLRFNNK